MTLELMTALVKAEYRQNGKSKSWSKMLGELITERNAQARAAANDARSKGKS